MEKSFVAQNGQSIYDICIQCGYPLEKITELMQLNNIANTNEVFFAGKIINFNTDNSSRNIFKDGEFVSSGEFVNPYDGSNGDVGNYLLRQDENPFLRQDGNKFLRQ